MNINGYEIDVLPPDDRSHALLEAVLLFHYQGPWHDVSTHWFNRMQTPEATTKILCDKIRNYFCNEQNN